MRYLDDVVTLRLDAAKCNGCRMCLTVCPHNVFRMEDKRAVLQTRDACMECGACMLNCAAGALTVRSGVGCASGIINGILRGTDACCDNTSSGCC
ncbi:MAG: 4Fe-4S dicluster domain-containing protein [bacterium]|nr:4Fe-4S dicluster domain-containing protein [bacterium]